MRLFTKKNSENFVPDELQRAICSVLQKEPYKWTGIIDKRRCSLSLSLPSSKAVKIVRARYLGIYFSFYISTSKLGMNYKWKISRHHRKDLEKSIMAVFNYREQSYKDSKNKLKNQLLSVLGRTRK